MERLIATVEQFYNERITQQRLSLLRYLLSLQAQDIALGIREIQLLILTTLIMIKEISH